MKNYISIMKVLKSYDLYLLVEQYFLAQIENKIATHQLIEINNYLNKNIRIKYDVEIYLNYTVLQLDNNDNVYSYNFKTNNDCLYIIELTERTYKISFKVQHLKNILENSSFFIKEVNKLNKLKKLCLNEISYFKYLDYKKKYINQFNYIVKFIDDYTNILDIDCLIDINNSNNIFYIILTFHHLELIKHIEIYL